MFVIELAYLPSAKANCPAGFLAFYKITIVLQSITLIRMFLFCIHFRRGRLFYRWLKRQFKCLQTVECEERLSLDIYRLQDYVAKIKGEVAADDQ